MIWLLVIFFLVLALAAWSREKKQQSEQQAREQAKDRIEYFRVPEDRLADFLKNAHAADGEIVSIKPIEDSGRKPNGDNDE